MEMIRPFGANAADAPPCKAPKAAPIFDLPDQSIGDTAIQELACVAFQPRSQRSELSRNCNILLAARD
jgi:hypothetical protein